MQKMYPDSTVNRIGPGRPYRANETWVPDAWYDRLAGEELIRRVRAEVKADKAGNLFLEESENADGSGATVTATAAVTANSTTEIPWTSLSKQYYRLRYVNGATAHTTRPYLFMETAGRTLTDTQPLSSSVTNAVLVAPSDGANLTNPSIALYVGVAGDVKVDLTGGTTITMTALAAGVWHPIRAKRVYAAGTTATSILYAY